MQLMIRCIPLLLVRLVFLALLSMMPCLTSAHEQSNIVKVPDYAENLKRIQTILDTPEKQFDLARAELTIDKMIDPTIDVEANLQKIKAIVTEIKAKLPANVSSLDKMQTLRGYLYQKGSWNNYQAFQYDFDDPLGRKVINKLLPHYLATKKGNCVSMPLLFIVLGQKLGIDVTAALAPAHVFVKYRDDAGNWLNLETTGTAKPTRDAWYREQQPMTDQAIANGIYMRPLAKKEVLTVILNTLMQHYREQRQYGQVIALADLVLERYPKSVTTLLYRSGAYMRLQDNLLSEYDGIETIPFFDQEHFKEFGFAIQADLARAEALGWREPTPEHEAKYLQTVKQHIQTTQ